MCQPLIKKKKKKDEGDDLVKQIVERIKLMQWKIA